VCVKNKDYPASLELRKLYQVVADEAVAKHHQLRVIDETGGDYLCPEEYFVSIQLPQAAEKAVLRGKPHFCEITLGSNEQPGAPSLRFLQGWDATDTAYRAFSRMMWKDPTLSHGTRKDGVPSGTRQSHDSNAKSIQSSSAPADHSAYIG
jgi:hypothetical protein